MPIRVGRETKYLYHAGICTPYEHVGSGNLACFGIFVPLISSFYWNIINKFMEPSLFSIEKSIIRSPNYDQTMGAKSGFFAIHFMN